MTYSISLTGHGSSADDAKEVFSDTVRALRAINAEAGSDAMVSGSINGTDADGANFSMSAADVQDIEAADTDPEVQDHEDNDGDA